MLPNQQFAHSLHSNLHDQSGQPWQPWSRLSSHVLTSYSHNNRSLLLHQFHLGIKHTRAGFRDPPSIWTVQITECFCWFIGGINDPMYVSDDNENLFLLVKHTSINWVKHLASFMDGFWVLVGSFCPRLDSVSHRDQLDPDLGYSWSTYFCIWQGVQASGFVLFKPIESVMVKAH